MCERVNCLIEMWLQTWLYILAAHSADVILTKTGSTTASSKQKVLSPKYYINIALTKLAVKFIFYELLWF